MEEVLACDGTGVGAAGFVGGVMDGAGDTTGVGRRAADRSSRGGILPLTVDVDPLLSTGHLSRLSSSAALSLLTNVSTGVGLGVGVVRKLLGANDFGTLPERNEARAGWSLDPFFALGTFLVLAVVAEAAGCPASAHGTAALSLSLTVVCVSRLVLANASSRGLPCLFVVTSVIFGWVALLSSAIWRASFGRDGAPNAGVGGSPIGVEG
mmetsp:Transcript_8745/g.21482  ORF Transcript_8745/g.21482 Transcript_8745/m.21482 type:complete len:209 (-) Transcript_8745:191-817(-)